MIQDCQDGYESEGEPTEGQQESPDGLMVVSVGLDGESCSMEGEEFFDCQENCCRRGWI